MTKTRENTALRQIHERVGGEALTQANITLGFPTIGSNVNGLEGHQMSKSFSGFLIHRQSVFEDGISTCGIIS